MVFRGKPSRACERCRERRMKCDFRPGACNKCVRAGVCCPGYRQIDRLRIVNESKSVARKLDGQTRSPPSFQFASSDKSTAIAIPSQIGLDAEYVSLNAFFAHHVSSKCWQFLEPFYDTTIGPTYLMSAIQAVSYAFLWHQTGAEQVSQCGRFSYVASVRDLRKVLADGENLDITNTIMTSLLLDVYEKITNTVNPARATINAIGSSCHIDGALALVSFRGLEGFVDIRDVPLLARLMTYYICNRISAGEQIEDRMSTVLHHVNANRCSNSPIWRMTELKAVFAEIVACQTQLVAANLFVVQCLKLDQDCQEFVADLPLTWLAKSQSSRHSFSYGTTVDIYEKANVCQARNFLRALRILLNSMIASSCGRSQATAFQQARLIIYEQALEICASLPPYTHACSSDGSLCKIGVHTVQRRLEVYTIIFPAYVAALVEPSIRPWVRSQLLFVAEHFAIRQAENIAILLEESSLATTPSSNVSVNVWNVYQMLGSYAFAT